MPRHSDQHQQQYNIGNPLISIEVLDSIEVCVCVCGDHHLFLRGLMMDLMCGRVFCHHVIMVEKKALLLNIAFTI